MTELQLEYPCPVCLGATLQKVQIAGPASFVLDHCPRCGGVWFEHGEVGQLRQCSPEDLWKSIMQAEGVHLMQCHGCSALVDRNDPRCAACNWENRIDCPVCGDTMETGVRDGVKLDACRNCKGVWFDRHELSDIWRLEFTAALDRRGGRAAGMGYGVIDAMAFDPFLTFYGAHAVGHVAAAGIGAAPAVLEAASEAATSVFEVIVGIISDMFG